jgi:hypothetical protein
LNWQAFLVFDFALYATLVYHEKINYTRPINVRDVKSFIILANDLVKRKISQREG